MTLISKKLVISKKLGISRKLGLRLAALTAATVGLSGCVYDVGLGYASDDFGYNDYDCDPYSPFDRYYACDNSYGFYNIGFGGGWYDSFWYPGHGYYVFDNYGRRFNMRDNHRRYWGDRRQRWFRDNRGHDNGYGHGRSHDNGYGYGRGRDHDDRRGDGRGHDRRDDRGRGDGRNATNGGVDQPIGWPEGNGGRRDERPGRRAEPTSPPGAVGDGDWGRRGDGPRGGRGDGRRGRDGIQGNGGQGNDAVQQPMPQPLARPGPDRRDEGRGRGDGGGSGRYQQPSNDAPQSAPPPQQPVYRAQPQPRQRDAEPSSRRDDDGPQKLGAPDRQPD
jgi:hypothetical protein